MSHVPDPPIPLHRSQRVTFTPSWLNDYECHCIPSTSTLCIPHSYSTAHMSFVANLSSLHEPKSYFQASKDKNLVDAMHQELQALEKNETWPLHLCRQLDVNNTFFHGKLDEEVYMDLPKGFTGAQPRQLFTIKDLGQAKYFMGLELARSSHGLHVTQHKYLQDILADTSMLDAKPAPTSFPSGLKLVLEDGALLLDLNRYRRLGIPSTSLFFSSVSSTNLTAYIDVSWVSCLDSCLCITGYYVLLGSSLISWKTKKQATVSRSSAEAEYRIIASIVCELLWISYLLRDFEVSVPLSLSIPLWCDNQVALYITANPMFHERTKYLDIDCHLVRA
ncbi:UNVERIFIED_CONTAM: Retrovirus-related Pol polyprotein from transposon RE1 [Sesamum radiatum]|uniref:Retrovirus-related Pol polyprotein from transposon RE1 n=1 Tax=Sesamum radiatum TaxID=300843 RepID=A0AAW2L1S5_SESRA